MISPTNVGQHCGLHLTMAVHLVEENNQALNIENNQALNIEKNQQHTLTSTKACSWDSVVCPTLSSMQIYLIYMKVCRHAYMQICRFIWYMKIWKYADMCTCRYDMKIWCARPCRPCRGAATLRGSHGPSCGLGTSWTGRGWKRQSQKVLDFRKGHGLSYGPGISL